jgi:NADH:ubiquinone reductase (H+-translocating)
VAGSLVWAAASAVRLLRDHGATATVTLVSAGDDLILRPRLYEGRPAGKRVSLDRVLGPLGVHRIAGTECGMGTNPRQIAIAGRDGDSFDLGCDRLVLATGSRLVRPPATGGRYLFDVDTKYSAAALGSRLLRLPQRQPAAGPFAAVVADAGFTGIEVATGLVERLRRLAGDPREVSVVLVDQAAVAGAEPREGPRPYILKALAELSIEVWLRMTVREAGERGVVLSGGTRLTAGTVVWTAGLSASPLTRMLPGGRDALGRLTVDEFLRVPGVPGVFAARDTAAPMASDGETVMRSC